MLWLNEANHVLMHGAAYALAAGPLAGDLPVLQISLFVLGIVATVIGIGGLLVHVMLRAGGETAAEEHVRALLDALPDAVLVCSFEDRVVSFNPTAAALFGDPTHLPGRLIRELLPFIPTDGERRGDGAPWSGSIAGASGGAVDVEVSRAVLAGGRLPARAAYIAHDISKYAELNRLREELLHNVAHEVRGPLSVLGGGLEILDREYATLSAEEFGRILRGARRAAAHLDGIVDDFLSAGSIRAGRLIPHCSPISVAAILDEALSLTGPMIAERGQQVERITAPDCPPVQADLRPASRALANLLSNACKYSPPGKPIVIRVDTVDEWGRIAVEDHGHGVPPAQRRRIFERFYRAHAENNKPGIGLGLAIAKSIVQAHGGTIDVDGTYTEGTRVWFTLPLARGSR